MQGAIQKQDTCIPHDLQVYNLEVTFSAQPGFLGACDLPTPRNISGSPEIICFFLPLDMSLCPSNGLQVRPELPGLERS